MPVRDAGSVSYSAAIESAATRDTDATASAFAQRVEREAVRRGFDRARRQVVLGDGAPWIWNLAGEAFPGAIQIVDRFHAKEHLSDVAKALYGAPSDLGDAWATARHAELDAGQLHPIVAALGSQYPRTPRSHQTGGHPEVHRLSLEQPAPHALPDVPRQGLCTSTAVVEAGCKVAIGTRLKRAGMHWSVRGANAIIALRSPISAHLQRMSDGRYGGSNAHAIISDFGWRRLLLNCGIFSRRFAEQAGVSPTNGHGRGSCASVTRAWSTGGRARAGPR